MENPNVPSGKPQIFKPKLRRLIDVLLFLNSLLLIILAFHSMPPALLGTMCLFINSFTILFWFFVLTPLMTIRISGNTVTGRAGNFFKQSIPFRKINFNDTIISPEGLKWMFVKDIHSLDGETIRIHRFFLGEGKVKAIIVTLERYPFREGTSKPLFKDPSR